MTPQPRTPKRTREPTEDGSRLFDGSATFGSSGLRGGTASDQVPQGRGRELLGGVLGALSAHSCSGGSTGSFRDPHAGRATPDTLTPANACLCTSYWYICRR